MMINHAIGRIFTAFLGAGCLAAPALAEGDAAASTERAILVLDASGSMWGQIDGTHKITIAREVIGDLLQGWDPNVHLGVTTYGHREKGNCADIEALTPLGLVDRSGVMAAIEGLNPKGKTPLTDAVRQAAEELRYTEERATVILISDGKETCNADPCAVAAELEADGIDFTVHVVGFDLDAEEKAQLQCIADGTGGQFLNADNAPELHEAMATTVQLVAEPEPTPQRVVKVETSNVGTLSLENVTNDYFYVYEPGKTSSDKLAAFGRRPKEPEQLLAGTYLIGNGEQEAIEIEVLPGEKTVVDMKDYFGWLSLENVTNDYFYVYEPGKTSSDKLAAFGRRPKEPEQLLAGTYLIGNGEQEAIEIEVLPGEKTVVDMKDYFGWLSLENVTNDYFYVYEPGKTSSDKLAAFGRRPKEPEQLRAGTYLIGNGKQEATEIEVLPGEETVVDMKELFGWLSVNGVASGYAYVYEPGKTSSQNVAAFGPRPKEPAQLRAGTYLIGNGKQELATIEIVPGEEVVVELEN